MATDLKRGVRLLTPEPLDLRYVVADESDRLSAISIGNYHDGILVFQQDTRTLWILKNNIWKQLYDEDETKDIFIQNVGNQSIAGSLSLIPTETPTGEGYIYYDDTLKCFKYTTDIPGANLAVGTALHTRVVNNTGFPLTKGTAVYIDVDGAHVALNEAAAVDKAIATEFDKSRVLGFVTTDINDGNQGYAIRSGILKGVDLSPYSKGTIWLSSDTPGGITTTRPTGGNYPIIMGYIVDNVVDGAILVSPLVAELTEESVTLTGWSIYSAANVDFNETTRVVTVSPKIGQSSYYWYSGGRKHISTGDSITIPDEVGAFLVYYEGDTLNYKKDPTLEERELLDLCCAEIATVFWRGAASNINYASDERQYAFMSTSTRAYLKTVFGLKYISGINPNNFTIGDGSLDSHSKFDISSGRLDYATLKVITPSKTTGIDVYYKDGTGDTAWTTDTLAGYSYLIGPNGRALINNLVGDTGSTSEVGNNNYSMMHIIAINTTNDDRKIIAMMGVGEYTSVSAAQSAVSEEFATIKANAWETMSFSPIVSVILQSSTTYTSTNKVRIVQTIDGANFIDWRQSSISGSGVATDGGGASNFIDLLDTPSTYTGKQRQLLEVNQTETGIAFRDPIWLTPANPDYTYTSKTRIGINTNNPSSTLDVNGTITSTGLIVNGDIIQQGSSYKTHTEEVLTKNNVITLRDGAVSGLGSNEFTGLVAKKYDGTNDGRLIFDSDGIAKVGDAGNEQPLAVRNTASNMVNGKIVIWDSALKRLITSTLAPADLQNDPYVTGVNFSTSSGVLNILRSDNVTLSTSLDNRYALNSAIIPFTNTQKTTHSQNDIILLGKEGSNWYPMLGDDLHRGVSGEFDLTTTKPTKIKINYPYTLKSSSYQLYVYGWQDETITQDDKTYTIKNDVQYKSLSKSTSGFEIEFFKNVDGVRFFTVYNTPGVSTEIESLILTMEVTTTASERTVDITLQTGDSVDWGDGTTDNLGTHTYNSNGTFTIKVNAGTSTSYRQVSDYPSNTVIKYLNADRVTVINLNYDPAVLTIETIDLHNNGKLHVENANIDSITVPTGDTNVELDLRSLRELTSLTINRKIDGRIRVSGATKLTSINWASGQVYKNTSAENMFTSMGSNTDGLLTLPTPTGFITNVTTRFGYMMQSVKFADSVTTLDFSSWNFSNAEYLNYAFASIKGAGLTTINGLGNLVTTNTRNIQSVFQWFPLTSFDFSGWDTSQVTNFSSAFSNTKFTTFDFTHMNFAEATDVSQMFVYATIGTYSNMSNISLPKATNIDHMFAGAVTTGAFDVSGWTKPLVTSAKSFLPQAASYNLNNFITSSITNMQRFAGNWSGLLDVPNNTSLTMTGWDTSNVTDMREFFRRSTLMNLAGWETMNTSKVTNMSSMFELSRVRNNRIQTCLESWDMSAVTNVSKMFATMTIDTGVTLTLPADKLWNNSSITSYAGAFSGILPADQAKITNWADIPAGWK